VVEHTLAVEQDHKPLFAEIQEFQVEVEQEHQILVVPNVVLLIQVEVDLVVGLQVMELEVLG
jgi:hypothetical protein